MGALEGCNGAHKAAMLHVTMAWAVRVAKNGGVGPLRAARGHRGPA
jgi:hypothetical protein